MRRKKKEEPVSLNPLPKELKDSEISKIKKHFPGEERINSLDVSLIKNISSQFIHSGVLEEKEDIVSTDQSVDDLQGIMEESFAFARSEKELNPDYYDPTVEEELEKSDDGIDHAVNPILDNTDDLGLPIYGGIIIDNDSNNESSEVIDASQDLESFKKKTKITLPDGTTIEKDIYLFDQGKL